MPPLRPTPPQLATLHTKPSWHNRAGRIDRSGCFQLRASTIWRGAKFLAPSPTASSLPYPALRGRVGKGALSKSHAKPCMGRLQRPRCIATATRYLNSIIFERFPRAARSRELVGDHRTRKSNVMKSRFDNRPGEPAVNPNKGPDRTKMFGIPIELWEQTLTIQRWRFPLPPRYDPRTDSVRPHARTQHFILCPRCQRKVCKLFLPMCSEEELRDAILAQQYATLLATHPLTRNAPLTPHDAAIITRYRAIFAPRTFTCGPCLHLRYGEAKGRNCREKT